jgi:Cu/Ag efflux protein CusF
MVKGEVVKVDKAAGKVTLKHGPIKKLDMDSMTMVFRVAEPAMLDKVKAGDRIEFEADRVNDYVIKPFRPEELVARVRRLTEN